MLPSLGKDPKLYMKVACAIYWQQPTIETSIKGTILLSNHGLNTFDTKEEQGYI